ncbi:MAG TPA: ABC transporter permease, partial [Thermomicrobiales bacterium]|nr:ABC transporter permease [Thermomicrobiales bacterium]
VTTDEPRLGLPARQAKETGELARNDRPGRSTRREAIRTLSRDRAASLGFFLFFVIVAAAIFAPLIAPHDPTTIQMRDRFAGPSWSHPLGADELGRDLLSRLIYGARASMSVGVLSVGLAALIGIPLGLIGSYYGGKSDSVIMRLMDGLLAFPAIILALAIMTALGPSLINAMIAIGIVYIPTFARIMRSSVLGLKEQDFVEAARAIGSTDWRLMYRVVLPNCLSPLIVQVTVGFANAILTEAALSFLGLGVQPPTPSWGAMLAMGRRFLTQTAWYSTTAGAAIFLAVLSLNLVGDGLRDALDPRLRNRR